MRRLEDVAVAIMRRLSHTPVTARHGDTVSDVVEVWMVEMCPDLALRLDTLKEVDNERPGPMDSKPSQCLIGGPRLMRIPFDVSGLSQS